MNALLAVSEVYKDFGKGDTRVRVLKGVDLEVRKNEIIVILGKSGSGKTTLLNILGGILPPDEGRVILNGDELYSLNDKMLSRVRNLNVGYIFQDFQLINELNVIENIRLPFDISNRKYDKEYENKVIDMLDLRKRLRFYPSQLSGGEKQRVAVARALIKRPDVILADEPTGNLDQGLSDELIKFVKETNVQFGQAYVVVTHDVSWGRIADRIVYMRDGRLCDEK